MRLWFVCMVLLAVTAPASGVMRGWGPPPDSGDPDLAAGLAAWEKEDWRGVLEHISKVIERRPWDDNAHTLLGFAHRKLGDYERSLKHYREALELNPHHRGALEYLGEAYLELNRPDRAEETLIRLEAACRRIASGAGWRSSCDEWRELNTAIEAYRRRVLER